MNDIHPNALERQPPLKHFKLMQTLIYTFPAITICIVFFVMKIAYRLICAYLHHFTRLKPRVNIKQHNMRPAVTTEKHMGRIIL